VMDAQMLSVTYADVDGLLRDLRASTAGNSLRGRRRGLYTPRQLERLRRAYEPWRRDGKLPATVELVVGHAWGAPPVRAVSSRDGEVRFPVDALRRQQ